MKGLTDMPYVWVFENEYGDRKYFASPLSAYNYSRLYLKSEICGDEDIPLDELDEDIRESFQAALDELAHRYSGSRAGFGIGSIFDVQKEEVCS